MKKIYIFGLLCCAILATGCQKDDGEKTTPPAEYTIMLYGCGGGNLDSSLLENLKQAKAYGSTDKVKMTAQVKFSKHLQDQPETAGTQRFMIIKDGIQHFSATSASLALNDPANIAEFIRWSKMTAPANNYILVLWNHGNGWLPGTDPKSRAIIFDDNLDKRAVSLNELVAGIKLSKTHLKMVYYDACLMLMLENLCDMSSVADYALGAEQLIPDEGGNYTQLLKELNEASSFQEAMTRYTKTVIETWEPNNYPLDISVTDLKKLTPVTDILRQVSQELVATYPKYGTLYNNAVTSSHCADSDSPFYDVVDYVNVLASTSKNAKLASYATSLREAAKQAIVCSQRTKILGTQEIYWATTLVNKTTWAASYSNGSYAATRYDQATAWSRWLELNESPIPLPNSNNNSDPGRLGNL